MEADPITLEEEGINFFWYVDYNSVIYIGTEMARNFGNSFSKEYTDPTIRLNSGIDKN